MIFTEMVKKNPESSGIEGIISSTLGKAAGSGITFLVVSTVIIALPFSCLIAGKYVSYLFANDPTVKFLVATAILFIGVTINLLNIEISSKIQIVIAFSLMFFGMLLILFSTKEASTGYHQLMTMPRGELILPGITVAFYAFAGLESMSFIAGEFKNPCRDFFLSMMISIMLCGLIYFFLSVNFAALIGNREVNSVTGLYQLIGPYHSFSSSFRYLLVGFAIFVVMLSTTTWIRATSRLVYSSSQKNKFFSYFSKLDEKGIPKRSVLFLGCSFLAIIIFDSIFPHLVRDALILASTSFVAIYILSIGAYLKIADTNSKKILAGILILVFSFSALSSGIKLLYPAIVYFVGYLFYYQNGHRNLPKYRSIVDNKS